MNEKKDPHDKAVEDSFPASDPRATTGITGPRVGTKTEQSGDKDEQQRKQ